MSSAYQAGLLRLTSLRVAQVLYPRVASALISATELEKTFETPGSTVGSSPIESLGGSPRLRAEPSRLTIVDLSRHDVTLFAENVCVSHSKIYVFLVKTLF